MEFRFGSEVRERDESRLGELTRIVFDPGTKQIASLVVMPSAIEQDEVVVPIGAVRAADDESVSLDVDHDQFLDDLDSFQSLRNIAPPPETEPGEEPGLPGVPLESPVGAATGVESIAYTPILEETPNIPAGDLVIDGNTIAWATDGELGKVKQINVNDQTRRATAFIVESGLVFTHSTVVPMNLVTNTTSETITVSSLKRDLEDSNA